MKLVGLLTFLVGLSACGEKQPTVLTIAAAANVQFAIDSIAKTFSATTGIPCHIIPGSSGKLTAQIREGAPFDIFISADTAYPQMLFNDSITTNKPRVYALGALVWWTVHDSLPHLNRLATSSIEHIAIANPKTAPYGEAAIEVLRYYGQYDMVKEKLVYGESISQTNQFILSGAVDAGFTSRSTVMTPGFKPRGIWSEIDTSSYSPIKQAAVILKGGSAGLEEKVRFFNFLFSFEAKGIFANYGYKIPSNE